MRILQFTEVMSVCGGEACDPSFSSMYKNSYCTTAGTATGRTIKNTDSGYAKFEVFCGSESQGIIESDGGWSCGPWEGVKIICRSGYCDGTVT